MNQNVLYYIRRGSIILLIVVIVIYSFFQIRTVLFGPHITVFSPINGTTYTKAMIDVRGQIDNANYVSMDGAPLYTDKNGAFNQQLLLLPGYTIIRLDAENKFGKKTEVLLQVILQESVATSVASSSVATTTNQ